MKATSISLYSVLCLAGALTVSAAEPRQPASVRIAGVPEVATPIRYDDRMQLVAGKRPARAANPIRLASSESERDRPAYGPRLMVSDQRGSGTRAANSRPRVAQRDPTVSHDSAGIEYHSEPRQRARTSYGSSRRQDSGTDSVSSPAGKPGHLLDDIRRQLEERRQEALEGISAVEREVPLLEASPTGAGPMNLQEGYVLEEGPAAPGGPHPAEDDTRLELRARQEAMEHAAWQGAPSDLEQGRGSLDHLTNLARPEQPHAQIHDTAQVVTGDGSRRPAATPLPEAQRDYRVHQEANVHPSGLSHGNAGHPGTVARSVRQQQSRSIEAGVSGYLPPDASHPFEAYGDGTARPATQEALHTPQQQQSALAESQQRALYGQVEPMPSLDLAAPQQAAGSQTAPGTQAAPGSRRGSPQSARFAPSMPGDSMHLTSDGDWSAPPRQSDRAWPGYSQGREEPRTGPDLPPANYRIVHQPADGDLPPPGDRGAVPGGIDYLPKPIGLVDATITPPGDRLPRQIGEAVLESEASIAYPGRHASRGWLASGYYWTAPASCHRPLFFEEVNVERYGYSFGAMQPVVSAGHFSANLLAMPYRHIAENGRVCKYTLGHDRPGDRVPYRIHYPRLSPAAGLLEAGLIVGLVFVIP